MSWQKNIQPVQPSTVEDPRIAAGQIDGLLEASIISSDGTVCSNLICRKAADTEGSGLLLAGAASEPRELSRFSVDTASSLTCQGPTACLSLRSISSNQLLYLVFQFALSLVAYHAAYLATHRGGLRKSSASI